MKPAFRIEPGPERFSLNSAHVDGRVDQHRIAQGLASIGVDDLDIEDVAPGGEVEDGVGVAAVDRFTRVSEVDEPAEGVALGEVPCEEEAIEGREGGGLGRGVDAEAASCWAQSWGRRGQRMASFG